MTLNPCPLCHAEKTRFFANAMNRDYLLCDNCKLIFVPRNFFLTKTEEKKRYDLHENSIEDKAYVRFLSQIIQAVEQRVIPHNSGLDFGSGPSPVLAKILSQKGYDMQIYDTYYATNRSDLNKEYEFICLSEVAEHFHDPNTEFTDLVKLLKPNAFLFVMTSCTDSIDDFKNWHYQRDDTHVCFYATESMQYIAKKHQLSLEKVSEKLFVFQKI